MPLDVAPGVLSPCVDPHLPCLVSQKHQPTALAVPTPLLYMSSDIIAQPCLLLIFTYICTHIYIAATEPQQYIPTGGL